MSGDIGVDYWQVAAVKARYFRFMDLKEWQNLRGIFTDDAVFDHPTVGYFENPDDAVEALRTVIGEVWTSHEGSIPDITVEAADRASAVFAMTGHARPPGSAELLRTFGHYYDEFRKDTGIWKISSMKLVSSARDL
jgi:hypothetical protein